MAELTQAQVLERAHRFLMDDFHNLPDYAREYLKSRGLSYNYLKRAGCGFLNPESSLTLQKNTGKAARETLKKVGFITPSEQFLSDAIYFPLYDHDGRIYSFSIRLLPTSEFVKNGGSPHWTMKIPISYPIGCNYPKSGLDPYRGRATFVCEGAPDTITLLQNGYNAIGLVGISNWRDQYIDFLHTSGIVIAFDRDENLSGQKASAKLARRLASAGLQNSIYFLELPMGEDINSFYDENFFAYSKSHMRRFLDTKTGSAWVVEQTKKAAKKHNNQMSEKIRLAKEKRIVNVFQHLFGNSPLYEFERGYKTLCPFHRDHRASLHLYTDTNSFFCFGCQAAGDTIDLVRRARPQEDFNREILPLILEVE